MYEDCKVFLTPLLERKMKARSKKKGRLIYILKLVKFLDDNISMVLFL